MAAKYAKIDEPVFVTRILERDSKYGNGIFEIHMTGIQSRINYKTYADPQNVNYRRWEPIIKIGDGRGIVLNNLKLKTAPDLINADSDPQIKYVVTLEELAEELAEYWKNQDRWNKWR